VSPGNEVLSDSQVRLGAASLQGIVTVDGTLGTITLKTASDFSGQATVTVSLISLGPSTSDRTEYDADDLGIAVGVNGATTGGVADFTSLEVAVVALSGGQEVTSARVDPDTGDYRLSYLPAGTYDVQIEATDGLVGSPEVASGVVVVAGEETGDVDFSLSGTPSE
jgi:hypothetical protein